MSTSKQNRAAVLGTAFLSVALIPAGIAGAAFDPNSSVAAPARPGPPAEDVRVVDVPVTAWTVRERLRSCRPVSRGAYATDEGRRPTVPVCGQGDVVHWTADLDIDCDGLRTRWCNEETDPYFRPETAFHQADGIPLRADRLPYVVVPAPGEKWDHAAEGVGAGDPVVLLHGDRIAYAVIGDVGPADIIGEASYAAAEALGLDPHPVGGGARSGVTYLVFKDAPPRPLGSRQAAVEQGERLLRSFVNP
ncbi:glycoside hydrolase family 75 protein [Streptomyces abyssomicinicus]|uniref:glycoside hydrolase family 75 protein n=1 Tax=Streptomyces abyssomicinicus TaxID=574929 RepID=UPI00125051FA|nr:glycoside hydrolase family 75 protein [Streptomyces abyssomicinicus]